MRCPRWLAPVLLLTLLVSVGSVHAATGPALTDRGRSVVYVDGQDKDIPNLLPAADVEKLLTLTQGEVFTQLISTVSPDDQGILVVEGENLGFLNIQTGGFVPVDVSAFDRIFPVALQGIGGWAWRDGRTLTSIGVELVDPREFIVRIVLVTLDRTTGAVRSIPLPDFPEDDFPISLSPNAGRLLLVRSEFTDEPAEVLTTRLNYPTIKSRIEGGLPTRVRNQFATWKSKSPLVQKLLQYRPLLDTEGDSISVIRQELSLLVYDTASGETSELKKLAQGTDLLNFAWSQDGARLAASFSGIFDHLEDVTAPRRPFLDGALLSEQVYRDATGNLDPKDNPFFQNNTIETYDFGTGETHELRAAAGDGALLMGVSWSTDGKTLAALAMDPARLAGRRFPIYTFQFSQRTSVRFYSFDLTPVRRLERPELAGSIFTTDVRFATPDELIIRAPVGTNYHPYYYNLRSGEFRNIADRAGSYYQVRTTRLSRQLVFNFTSFTNPADVYRMNLDGSAVARVTWNNEELAQFSKTRQYPVSFRLANGENRVGTLILPADVPFPPRNIRIVVWQQGGPGGMMNNEWSTFVEQPYALLPNFGFGVLSVPLAGREGNNPAVYNKLADRGNFGQADIDEQAEITRQMISRGWTSQGKVGITGCSYGGYFVLQSVIRYPDLYSAANPQCALVDNITEWSRGYASLMPYLEGLPPFANPGEYRADSPIYNTGRIKTPTLTFHGTNDFLPITQNENLHLQLTSQGVPARMLVFVGAGHGLVGRDSLVDQEVLQKYQIYAAQEQINWFRNSLR